MKKVKTNKQKDVIDKKDTKKQKKTDEQPKLKKSIKHNETSSEQTDDVSVVLKANEEGGCGSEKPEEKKQRKKVDKGILALSISSFITLLIIAALVINLLAPDLYRRIFYSTPLDRGGVVMTIGNYEVMADEYTSDLLSAASIYEGGYGKSYWYDNPSHELELLRDLENYYIERYTKLTWADELGVELTDAEIAEIDTLIDNMSTMLGGSEAFAQSLGKSYMNEDLYRRLAYIDARIAKFEQALTDGGIGEITVDDIKNSIDAKGVVRAKHILFMTTGDETGDAAQKRLAENVLERILAGEDFDILMQEYSEDIGLETYPDGYTFGPGEMVLEFENAVMELEIGEISGIVETAYGYHIIQRLEVDYEDYYDVVFTERYNAKLLEMVEGIEISYGRGYQYISITDVRWK